MENIQVIIKSIVDYGISVILSAIVIYVIIRLLKYKFDDLEKKKKRNKHDEAINMRSKIDDQVYDIINKFIATHKSTRVQVIEFTNTVTSVAYLPFRYMTCTYEVTEYGRHPKATYIDKLSTSLFSPFLSRLANSDTLLLDKTDAEDLSGSIEDLFNYMGCKYMLSAILSSEKNNKFIGYVSIYKEEEITDLDKHDIKILSEELSLLLGVLDK